MIASAETGPREWLAGHRIGEQEGRQKTWLSERAECVRLFGGGETNPAFRQRWRAGYVFPALAQGPACGVSVRRDPLLLPEASRGHAFTRLDENA